MKATDPRSARCLQDIPNVGPATESDLQRLGIRQPSDLAGQDAFKLYRRLCNLDDSRHDPCVIDVFMAAIHFMETGETLPWHDFSAERKRLAREQINAAPARQGN